jgi:mRNA interferase MazF
MARAVKRGDVIIVSPPGDFGKPRPAIVVQSDWLNTNSSVLVAPCTSAQIDAPLYRLALEPNETNGLKASSQVMIDKITPVLRVKCGAVIGSLDLASLVALNNMLSVVIGLAD